MQAPKLAVVALSLIGVAFTAGCDSKSNAAANILALPASYDPVGAELTFNKAGLEKFNLMSESERDAFIEGLKSKEGSLKGQALVRGSAGLGSAMPDHVHGDWEVMATTRKAVLYEIVVDYSLFTSPAVGRPLAENRAIEFSGTVVSAEYKDDTKPRTLFLKVKSNDIQPLSD